MPDQEPNRRTTDALTPEGWGNRYREGRTAWDRGQPSPALAQFLATSGLTSGHVLVPGCGQGHEVIELARRGFEVTAVDFAPEPLQELGLRLTAAGLSAELVQDDVLKVRFDRPFDAVYEQTCLCALHPDTWPSYAASLREWLRPGGWLFAVFMQTDWEGGPPFHCDIDVMRQLFPADIWEWTSTLTTVPHPAGVKELAVILKKISSN